MRSNIIVLTSGLSGSSVLTALIVRAGYWAGDSTQQKEDYDTYENKQLIGLNQKLIALAEYTGNYTTEFSGEAIARIGRLSGTIEDGEYRAFVERCMEHRPWVWKDPRLWLTIRFWKNLLDLDDCKFIFLTRGFMQSWISALLRGQVRTYRDYTVYEERIQSSVLGFFADNDIRYLHVQYEELIVHPTKTIQEINGFSGISLTLEDLKSVYRKPLFRNPRPSYLKYLKAFLIYLKNYPKRTRALMTPE